MNINLDHSADFEDLPDLFFREGSPYLSPFMGSLSPQFHPSSLELDNFQLENHLEQIGGAEFGYENIQVNEEKLFDQKQIKRGQVEIRESIGDEAQKSQIQTPRYVGIGEHSRIYCIIEFLVRNSEHSQQALMSSSKKLCQGQQNLQLIFEILLRKFKKLKKTKEEMIKYCMRKAFKFIADTRKNKKAKNPKFDQALGFIEMPFRKNSSQKTMNAQYLKQVFSEAEFLTEYQRFLGNISSIIEDDNISKIEYLSDMIEKMVKNNELSNIEKIKRLPWSQPILKKTEELARGLLEFADLSLTDVRALKVPSLNRQQQQFVIWSQGKNNE